MEDSTHACFPVAALGGSAGGLQAFTTFLEAVEALGEPPGIAFIIVPHLSPDHESHIAELLQRTCRLPVSGVTQSTAIDADHVYVLMPGQTLFVRQGRMEPQPREPGADHHPVDDIFASLGAEFGPRAVAVVLSGTGSNGSAGLTAVRENGGLVLAQAPDTAEFGEMPRRAIDTGLVDSVLPPEEMAGFLTRYAEHLRSAPAAGRRGDTAEEGQAEEKESGDDGGGFSAILGLLEAQSSIDFRHYKFGTLQRRIDRRVQLNRLDSWNVYAEVLRKKPEELEALADDLLITVTGFFRDEKAWDTLKEQAIRPLVEAHHADRPIRAWVAGCATGEEAYSLAMLLSEETKAQERALPVEIFATDASDAALARARQGLYPAAAVQHLSEKRRNSHFERGDDRVRVKQQLRECVVFAPQNLLQDPPFSRIDLVICRNVLIYLQPETQQKLIRLFHFALREDGYMLLGSAETIAGAEHLFDTISKKWRLYRRVGPTRHDIVDFPISESASRFVPRYSAPEAGQRPAAHRTEEALKALADWHAPPSVLIDGSFQVLYYHGATERYLKSQSGEPSRDLLTLAREGLGLRLRRLIGRAKKANTPQAERMQLGSDGGTTSVVIEVIPIDRGRGSNRLLVSFMEESPAAPSAAASASPASSREQELEAEVKFLREEIEASTKFANRSQEELKAYNEEIVSMNEELRAANEELETSKEELQSLNEELNTVNSQLRAKLDELNERTNDLDNLLTSTDMATLFLDPDLCIRWFSPKIEELFHVRATDTGRQISDFAQKFTDEVFTADCEQVLRTLTPAEKEVSSDGRWFIRRIVPYRTRDHRIDGVVVTFSDITAVQAGRHYAERIVETVPSPLLVLDPELRVVSANPAFYERFRVRPEETEQRLIYDLGNGQWNIPALRRLLTDVLPHDDGFRDQEVEHDFEHIGRKVMLVSGRRLDHVQLILLAIEDITERKRNESQQAMLMAELNHRVKNALSVVQGLASQTMARSGSLDEFWAAFAGRLAAFARAHGRLLEREWTSTDLKRLVQDATDAFDPTRMSVEGPHAEVSSKKALALSLMLHELETNATKYGALAHDEGRVEIRWSVENGDAVRLIWQESGGPRVAPPKRDGFGTRLITQMAAHELGGDADLRFEPEGLRCELTFSRR